MTDTSGMLPNWLSEAVGDRHDPKEIAQEILRAKEWTDLIEKAVGRRLSPISSFRRMLLKELQIVSNSEGIVCDSCRICHRPWRRMRTGSIVAPPAAGVFPMPFVKCSVGGCNRKLQPILKVDPKDRETWFYPECDVCFRPVCDKHSMEMKGQIVCDECREKAETQQQASRLIDLGIRLDRREE